MINRINQFQYLMTYKKSDQKSDQKHLNLKVFYSLEDFKYLIRFFKFLTVVELWTNN